MHPSLPLSLILAGALAGCASNQVRAPAQSASEVAGTCGRISAFDAAPRSNDLYRARIIAIDGQLPGPTDARTYRVAPGRHAVQIAELIDDAQFNDLERRQRMDLVDRYKTLDLDVRPDTTYLVAARLVEARRSRILDASYWEPVVYRQIAEACQ